MEKHAPDIFLWVFGLTEDEKSDDKYKFSLDVWKQSHHYAAYEAGGGEASAYPGTPSTEIMENISK